MSSEQNEDTFSKEVKSCIEASQSGDNKIILDKMFDLLVYKHSTGMVLASLAKVYGLSYEDLELAVQEAIAQTNAMLESVFSSHN